MKTAAIIAEYNPFHNGHKYQIAETKRQTGANFIVVVMSGDFVQRGIPAMYSKSFRTRSALLSGADLVDRDADLWNLKRCPRFRALRCLSVSPYGNDRYPFLWQ